MKIKNENPPHQWKQKNAGRISKHTKQEDAASRKEQNYSNKKNYAKSLQTIYTLWRSNLEPRNPNLAGLKKGLSRLNESEVSRNEGFTIIYSQLVNQSIPLILQNNELIRRIKMFLFLIFLYF